MFGNGLVMSQGEEWVRHRHVITPAFNPTNLKAMASLIVETTNKMLDNWKDSGPQEIDVEREITATAGDIIAKTSFGISYQSGRLVFEKLIRTSQMTLFKTSRHVKIHQRVDAQRDLLGLLLKENERGFTTQELVDECKTFFFGSHETTALAIIWTMLLLATHQDWQHQLREEIREVVGIKKLRWTCFLDLRRCVYSNTITDCA
ncbi:hypothetical protein ACFX1X_001990 [Malus domestica]